jgi:hypothetical protein
LLYCYHPGTYILTAVINFRKSIIIRGEGRSRTYLKFPKSLSDLYGNTWTEGKWKGTSQYSHGSGFINIGGWDPTARDFSKLSDITAVRLLEKIYNSKPAMPCSVMQNLRLKSGMLKKKEPSYLFAGSLL